MVLTEEEKKQRKKEINRRYRAKLKKRAAAGDEQAQKQKERNRHRANFSSAKSFIKNEATRPEIAEIRDAIAERVKQLRQK